MNERFIQTQKLFQIIDLETFLFVLSLVVLSFLFYKFFLKEVSEERHISIEKQHKNLLMHFFALSVLYLLFALGSQLAKEFDYLLRLLPYLGFLTYLVGATCFIKVCRILVLQYLFLGSMRTGVPLLIVNIFSLILTIILIFWTVNNIFGVQIAPLLATSAAFSIILGLALQDTLGNLFAGISMQVDKNFEIGDWLEIMNGSTKIVGQVKEISWRSTVLIGFADEVITLPNKLISQCQVSNFSPESHAIVRGHTFKFGFEADIPKIIQILEQAAVQISDVKPHPAPLAFVRETHELGCDIRLIYYIENYGSQYLIGNKVITTALDLLAKNGIQTAKPVIKVYQD